MSNPHENLENTQMFFMLIGVFGLIAGFLVALLRRLLERTGRILWPLTLAALLVHVLLLLDIIALAVSEVVKLALGWKALEHSLLTLLPLALLALALLLVIHRDARRLF